MSSEHSLANENASSQTRGADFDGRAVRGTRISGASRRFRLEPDFVFDYKDIQTLRYFLSDRGKIVPRRISGLTATQQRSLAQAVKLARGIALLPYTTSEP